jgi:uncharacterized protein involved in exopolysaccharide biosynthesis
VILLAHITEADGPSVVLVLLIGVAIGLVLGLAVAGLMLRRRR